MLARRSGTCRIAFLHRPYLSAGEYSPGTRSLGSLWRTLRGHARLVLSGHDHNMQRFKRRDGMTQYVSGAGGRERYRVNRRDSRLAFGRADRFGALRIELDGDHRAARVPLGDRQRPRPQRGLAAGR